MHSYLKIGVRDQRAVMCNVDTIIIEPTHGTVEIQERSIGNKVHIKGTYNAPILGTLSMTSEKRVGIIARKSSMQSRADYE